MDKSQKKLVRKILKRRLQKLPYHTQLTVAQMFGSSRWNALRKGLRLEIGHYVRQLVDRGKLPLVRAEKTSSNHWRYQRV